jgi:hypothetical protein
MHYDTSDGRNAYRLLRKSVNCEMKRLPTVTAMIINPLEQSHGKSAYRQELSFIAER